MKVNSKQIGLNNNLIIKILSLILGYFFWLILVQNQKINISLHVPLCFYGIKENLEICDAPENIQVKLTGKRLDFANINYDKIAMHVDLSSHNQIGEYKIKLLENDIFLHNKIKLINYFPSEVLIQVKEKK